MDRLSGIVTGVAIAIVGAILAKLLVSVVEGLLPVVRVNFAGRWGKRRYEASLDVYGRLPPAIGNRQELIKELLSETIKTNVWQEIYLVYKGMDGVKGVLYASVYPQYRSTNNEVVPMCAINALVARQGLGPADALKAENRLWEKLRREVCKCTGQPSNLCHYFFLTLPGDAVGVSQDELSRRRELLALLQHIEARRVPGEYRFPDLQTYDRLKEVPAAQLYHMGPDATDEAPWGNISLKQVLAFVYEFHYFWRFIFGKEMTILADLDKRIEYIQGMIGRMRPGGAIRGNPRAGTTP